MTQVPAPRRDAPWKLAATFSLAGLLSGTALAGVHISTAPRIANNQAEALARAVLATVPGAVRFDAVEPPLDQPLPGAAYAAHDAKGQLLGYAVEAEGPGFMDTIRLLYGLDAPGARVVGLTILSSRETPGLGDKIASDPGFVGSFEDLRVRPAIVASTHGRQADDEVDCITGATVSSKAVIAIVQSSVDLWLPALETPSVEAP